MNERYHTTTVRCISNAGTLLAINAKEFFKAVQKDETAWGLLQDVAHERDGITKEVIRESIKARREYG